MRRAAGAIGRLVAALALVLATAGSALAAPALWAVRDEDSTIYLFGTMHMLTDEAEWRTPDYDRAFAAAAKVWFETDVGAEPEVIGPLLFELGFDMEGRLSDKVGPETMAAVRAALKDLPGIDRVAEHLEPWTAAMLVQLAPMLKDPGLAGPGADSQLNADAAARGAAIAYFETPEEQLRVFADLSLEAQVQFLEDSLRGEAAGGLEVETMQAAWIAGDIQLFGAMLTSEMRAQRPELYEALIRRRNLAWARVLQREMAGSGVAMVNVGALHLVGEDGLVTLLRRRGFVVERIQ